MSAPSDPRAVVEYRVPAADLKVGDLVNTSPGEGDWQQVTGVYRSGSDAGSASSDVRSLVTELGGRYVVVQLTDLLPVDGGIYFSAGTRWSRATTRTRTPRSPTPSAARTASACTSTPSSNW